MALDTLSNVKLALGVSGTTDDSLLTQLQAAADAYIVEHCGRSFEGGSFVELFPGGRRLLVLKNYPVASVTSIEVDSSRQFGAETIRDPSEYVVHIDRGVIENLAGPFVPSASGRSGADMFPGAVRVSYTTATSSVPAAVVRAYAELIGHWYRAVKTHVALGQLDQLSEFENGILTEFPRGLSEGFSLPPGMLELLQPYRSHAF